MKLAKTRQKGISKILAGALAFLFLIQTFAAFSFGAGPLHAGEYPKMERGASALCEKAGSNQSHTGNHCSHIGFCVLCSVQERGHEAFSTAAIQVASIILRIEPTTAAGPVAYFEHHRLSPPRQIGWKATWSATAPPTRA